MDLTTAIQYQLAEGRGALSMQTNLRRLGWEIPSRSVYKLRRHMERLEQRAADLASEDRFALEMANLCM